MVEPVCEHRLGDSKAQAFELLGGHHARGGAAAWLLLTTLGETLLLPGCGYHGTACKEMALISEICIVRTSLRVEHDTILFLLVLFSLPDNFLDSSGSVTPEKKGWQEFECEFQRKMKLLSSTQSHFLEAPGEITSPQLSGFLPEWNVMLRNDYLSKIDAHLLCTS